MQSNSPLAGDAGPLQEALILVSLSSLGPADGVPRLPVPGPGGGVREVWGRYAETDEGAVNTEHKQPMQIVHNEASSNSVKKKKKKE